MTIDLLELDDDCDYSDPQLIGYQDRLKHLRDTKGVARLRLGSATGYMLLRYADIRNSPVSIAALG